ncbi:MAG: WecB/TagA/CpsF family glycosyltransferase [Alkalibacterium sp.]|uniref:N-acetylglucosaminyldiphosphoundecaprenol N-acetyl-beta-D-mannosaminyltransferase n=1 Tax=Alkalibacterium gilvum TaxID=1130080 RepID=A0A1H6UGM4_9LACT|nr:MULTISPECIES: WecB/TagA/CpsF family glycosyltransferase [Alkalibacterium]MDN6193558.1 WecB/TagA/CpsF family glycosyltransferase [Alkalibacterium sp.]MDN6293001.1 WecB/TagA/CpsF family glycosyltransferase [Alkalibacterium sp.]MDN6296258.1 WecB/TagA/CpsF family glycosyltransferase [Alkalibacterium sp.]MDN6327105.1 WecB/TagA/CpsF family glycosyltransferase [Alkalibacterium sp.]MDN6385200.1 WecB/TagA/CpsF family glycosyltransferase [Alkalibacterium sp.]
METKVTILGVPFDNITQEDFLKALYDRLVNKQKTFLVTANPEIVMYARDNEDYYQLLLQADYIAPDGIGIVKAARTLGKTIKERVPGYELMLGLLEIANIEKQNVYFIGAQEDTIELTVSEVERRWPNINIVGYHHGYFNHADPKMIEKVKNTDPDLIFVAFGFPRQEKWISNYLSQASHGIAVGVGGSFDVLSGKTKRAPSLVQTLHVEWLYRLIRQPSRYKRMAVLPRFIKQIYKQKKKERNQ